jgi:hypothetical protein
LVLLFDLFTLLVGILLDLLHSFLIVIHHLFDLSLELLDLILLDLNKVVVVLLLFVNSSSVFLEQVGLGTLVRTRFFLLQALQFLILASVF